MKSFSMLLVFIASVSTSAMAAQQSPPPAPTAPAPATTPPPAPQSGMGASLNKSLGVFVYPAKNQDVATQEKDIQECYSWGKGQSGVDPLNPPDVQAAETAKGPDGTAVRSAARGAAAGAAIGAIAGDAGKGAAIGATAGGMGGVGARRQRQKAEAQQAQQAAVSQETELMGSFKKAYATCLQGKGYTVN